MKVLLVAKPWKGGLARYVYQALEGLFPGNVQWVYTYPTGIMGSLNYRRDKTAWKKNLVDTIRNAHYDAAIFINHFAGFEALRFSDTHIIWLTDGPTFTERELSPYGRVFVSDQGYEEGLVAAVGKKHMRGVLPFAFSPDIHAPCASSGRNRDICFIGNRDEKRDRQLQALLQAGFRCTIVGNYFLRHPLFWKYPISFHPSIANEKMGLIYARHRISLNIHAKVVRKGTNMRTFECAGYEIPQLVEYCEGIEEYFEPEREIAVYKDPEEMIQKAKEILGDSDRAQSMARKARERALSEHTYQHRVQTMLDGIM